jgi:hypothetical protein
MREYLPGTFEWDRAHSFLLQCEQPFRRDVEVSVLWRLLPALICHILGLRGWGALCLPWLGAICATFYVARLHANRLSEIRFVCGGTLLFATTAAVLVPVGWLGLNDGWMWLGLLAVAFADSGWTILVACVLCPWVDERFIIALPLAMVVRHIDRQAGVGRCISAALPGLVLYAGIRLTFSAAVAGPTNHYLTEQLASIPVFIAWVPLGWWMGLRVAWLPVAGAVRSRPWLLGGGAFATIGICLLLATDLSRSTAMLSPLMLLGVFQFAATRPDIAPRFVLRAGVANLLIPAAHITFTKFDRIDNLALELLRLRH